MPGAVRRPRADAGPPRRRRAVEGHGALLIRSSAHARASSSARATHWANRSPVCRSSAYAAHDPLDVVGQLVGGDLVAAQLAAEAGVEPEPAAEVHLEALDLVAVGVQDELALEADVGDLDAGARVGAAVDVDGERLVEVGQPALELVDRAWRRGPWSRRWPACRTRCRCRPSCCAGTCSAGPAGPSAGRGVDQRVDPVGRRRRGRPASGAAWCAPGASRAPRRCRRAATSVVPGHPADRRREADVVAAVLLAVHADVVARAVRAPGAPARRSACGRGTRSRAPRGTSRRPSRRRGT